MTDDSMADSVYLMQGKLAAWYQQQTSQLCTDIYRLIRAAYPDKAVSVTASTETLSGVYFRLVIQIADYQYASNVLWLGQIDNTYISQLTAAIILSAERHFAL